MERKFCYFEVGKLFPKNKKIKKYGSLPESFGNIPFVSSSAMNNGVSGYSDEISYSGKCITVSTNGKCFDSFYHEGDIGISIDVEILTNKNLNIYNGLYICSILNAESFKWGYGRKPKNDKVFKTKILLPICDSSEEPDWKYMEEYVKKITSQEYSFGTLDNCKKTKNTETLTKNIELQLKIFNSDKTVKLFKFSEIIDQKLYKATAYAKVDLDVSEYKKKGFIPFVSRTENNNAVDCYAQVDDCFNIESGNCIIIGDTTSTIFYQDEDFIAGDHIVVCRSKWINKYTAMYIKTLLDKERYRYSYGRAFKKAFIENTVIALPTRPDGKPDWNYIEQYIKSLPFADRI